MSFYISYGRHQYAIRNDHSVWCLADGVLHPVDDKLESEQVYDAAFRLRPQYSHGAKRLPGTAVFPATYGDDVIEDALAGMGYSYDRIESEIDSAYLTDEWVCQYAYGQWGTTWIAGDTLLQAGRNLLDTCKLWPGHYGQNAHVELLMHLEQLENERWNFARQSSVARGMATSPSRALTTHA